MMAAPQPEYMGQDFNSASPGQRFNYFVDIWSPNWSKLSEGKDQALKKITPIKDLSLSGELIARQLAQAESDLAVYSFEAISAAPMITGMGLEHPIENGFAFLRPYGLPYLPGSSVKGVFRTAAEELALGFDKNITEWNMFLVWILFGFDQDADFLASAKLSEPDVIQQEKNRRFALLQEWSEMLSESDTGYRYLKKITASDKITTPQELITKIASKKANIQSIRGALDFWDVLVGCKSLDIDILTPHQKHYYQDDKPPHDCGQPTPIPFLVIPDKSTFHFHIRANSMMKQAGIPEEIGAGLEQRLYELFEYACTWLGFGSKTSLGYGALEIKKLSAEEQKAEREAKEKAIEAHNRKAALADMPEDEKLLEEWILSQNPDRTVMLNNFEAILNLDSVQPKTVQVISEKMEQIYPGIMNNPDATSGKLQKPKFKESPKKIAKILLEKPQP